LGSWESWPAIGVLTHALCGLLQDQNDASAESALHIGSQFLPACVCVAIVFFPGAGRRVGSALRSDGARQTPASCCRQTARISPSVRKRPRLQQRAQFLCVCGHGCLCVSYARPWPGSLTDPFWPRPEPHPRLVLEAFEVLRKAPGELLRVALLPPHLFLAAVEASEDLGDFVLR